MCNHKDGCNNNKTEVAESKFGFLIVDLVGILIGTIDGGGGKGCLGYTIIVAIYQLFSDLPASHILININCWAYQIKRTKAYRITF